MSEGASIEIPRNSIEPEKAIASAKTLSYSVSHEVICGIMQDDVSSHHSDKASSWRTIVINPDHQNSDILGFLIKHTNLKPFQPNAILAMCLTPENIVENTQPARSWLHVWAIPRKNRGSPEIYSEFGEEGSNQVWTHTPTSDFLHAQTGNWGDMNCPMSLAIGTEEISADASDARARYDNFLNTVRNSALVSSHNKIRDNLAQCISEVLQARFTSQGHTNQGRVGQQQQLIKK